MPDENAPELPPLRMFPEGASLQARTGINEQKAREAFLKVLDFAEANLARAKVRDATFYADARKAMGANPTPATKLLIDAALFVVDHGWEALMRSLQMSAEDAKKAKAAQEATPTTERSK